MKNTYRYLCTARPPMPGGIPKGATKVEFCEYDWEDYGGHMRHVWGAVEYDRELTDSEIYEYELEFEGEGEE